MDQHQCLLPPRQRQRWEEKQAHHIYYHHGHNDYDDNEDCYDYNDFSIGEKREEAGGCLEKYSAKLITGLAHLDNDDDDELKR